MPPWVVTTAYGVSWLYLSGCSMFMFNNPTFLLTFYEDVGYETYKAHRQRLSAEEATYFSEPSRLALSAARRATFQSIASM